MCKSPPRGDHHESLGWSLSGSTSLLCLSLPHTDSFSQVRVYLLKSHVCSLAGGILGAHGQCTCLTREDP